MYHNDANRRSLMVYAKTETLVDVPERVRLGASNYLH